MALQVKLESNGPKLHNNQRLKWGFDTKIVFFGPLPGKKIKQNRKIPFLTTHQGVLGPPEY